MKQNIGLVVLEHLSHQLDVHVLDIDLLRVVNNECPEALDTETYLQALVHDHDSLIEFLLQSGLAFQATRWLSAYRYSRRW